MNQNQNFKLIISLIDIFFISISLLVVIIFGSLIVFGSTLKKDSFFSKKEFTKVRISQPSFILFIWCSFIALVLKLNQTSVFESDYFYYNNQVHLTGLILIFFFIVFGIICYSFFKKNSQLSFEFVLLLFFLLLSMLILISSSDLFVWFLTL